MFDAIYDQLAKENPPDYRFLCGDFNSPKEESGDGEVTVWGSDEDWISSERSVMVDLADYDLTDVYREVSGYGDDAYSWVAKNRGNEFPRRFDHVFASELLNAAEASYLHEYDNLSDHSPLEVVFTPKEGLHRDIEEIERSVYEPPVDENEDSPNPSPSHNGLSYEDDIRMVDPDANYRRGRFKVGWNKAVDGAEMQDNVLDQLTWENLGWRLGMIFGNTSDELKEELYEWCVEQQTD
ncbi:Exonuclease III [Halapricum desulfuricans]|uniref:Exonuclease III n=2 Tax=Halapricum desulfuricans TaxID=2841257 RepID=A0A897NIS8_9EURY|nr:Exonuclease III [Halapricum desulfuricans]